MTETCTRPTCTNSVRIKIKIGFCRNNWPLIENNLSWTTMVINFYLHTHVQQILKYLLVRVFHPLSSNIKAISGQRPMFAGMCRTLSVCRPHYWCAKPKYSIMLYLLICYVSTYYLLASHGSEIKPVTNHSIVTSWQADIHVRKTKRSAVCYDMVFI